MPVNRTRHIRISLYEAKWIKNMIYKSFICRHQQCTTVYSDTMRLNNDWTEYSTKQQLHWIHVSCKWQSLIKSLLYSFLANHCTWTKPRTAGLQKSATIKLSRVFYRKNQRSLDCETETTCINILTGFFHICTNSFHQALFHHTLQIFVRSEQFVTKNFTNLI